MQQITSGVGGRSRAGSRPRTKPAGWAWRRRGLPPGPPRRAERFAPSLPSVSPRRLRAVGFTGNGSSALHGQWRADSKTPGHGGGALLGDTMRYAP